MDEVAAALERVTKALPGAEVRSGQIEMAEAVGRAIAKERHLVVEAGTGTGKSLAYLVPAVLSGKRVVVATATKALQDQLAGKDLPFLREHLAIPFEFAVLKGRANYLCRQRTDEVVGGGDQRGFEELEEDDLDGVGELGREILALAAWSRTTETGDHADLDFEPRPRAWSAVSVTARECPGASRCPRGDDCFAEAARDRAASADVVVVNAHLYGTHLASGGYVLPEHEVVVFDEAHELEDVASSSLGFELSGGRFAALARGARTVVAKDDAAAVDQLEDSGDRLDDALRPFRGMRLPMPLDASIAMVIATGGERLTRLLSALRRGNGDDAPKERALKAATSLGDDLMATTAITDDDVAWVEDRDSAPLLKVAPVDVGPPLAAQLWGEVTAILTSATIPANLPTRLGIERDRVDVMDVGSPFPYEEHALLYCPLHLPDPRQPEYEEAMHLELERLIVAARGRTLALFTSWRAMHAAAEYLRPRLPWKVLTQSDLPKPALVRAFSDDEHSCLFATMGFWQGVDVPGPSLSMVAIDRLPFARPDDPLLQARRDKAGAAAFRAVDLPRAATLLAQGAGRLIRSATDRGVVAVLDPRLGKAGYRWDLVRALPPMRRTRKLSDVEAFFSA